ncbi:MAG: efflux RND transporter periplasmic adaptor subunit [Candidatus Firestonebacteria bacterium]
MINFKNKKIFVYIVLILSIILALVVFVKIYKAKNIDHTGHEINSEKPKKQLYHCPMHPTYIADKPGDCPICGMKLVPMEQKEENIPSKDKLQVSGQADIIISSEKEQLIGMKTEIIKKRDLVFTIRASGRIAHDPELYNAIIEYQRTISTRDVIKKSNPSDEVLKQAESLLESSRIRLKHLGLSDTQIQEIKKDDSFPTNLIMVDSSGKTVWVYAQVYEYEIGLVKQGQSVEVTSIALPGKKFTGIIKAIDPYLDSETRSLRVRAEIHNIDGLLKPEMFVDTLIRVEFEGRIAIPEDAVLDTGVRKLVFVKKAEGKYEPREVVLGHEADGYYEVLSGVGLGDRVVTSANFLIDSESKLKSAISGMQEHKH